MPNRVMTRCMVTGPRQEIECFRTTVIGVPEERDEETLDFNLIIPMPEALKHTVSGGSAPLGIEILTGKPKPLYGCRISIFPGSGELGITNTNELRCWAEKERPDAIKEGQKAIMVHRETGFHDWYDWSIATWGTKWNSYSFSIDDHVSDGGLSFHFDTAWEFPTPIFEKLASMFPTLRLECTCFDEGWICGGAGLSTESRPSSSWKLQTKSTSSSMAVRQRKTTTKSHDNLRAPARRRPSTRFEE